MRRTRGPAWWAAAWTPCGSRPIRRCRATAARCSWAAWCRTRASHDLIAGVPPDVPLTIVGAASRSDRVTASWPRWPRASRCVSRTTCPMPSWCTNTGARLCVVLPSVYRSAAGETKVPELLGQTLLEGMACGLPAVCTRVASMPEVVDDGVTGFVVPPNDPTALGERLAVASRRTVRRPPNSVAPAAGACCRTSPGRWSSIAVSTPTAVWRPEPAAASVPVVQSEPRCACPGTSSRASIRRTSAASAITPRSSPRAWPRPATTCTSGARARARTPGPRVHVHADAGRLRPRRPGADAAARSTRARARADCWCSGCRTGSATDR